VHTVGHEGPHHPTLNPAVHGDPVTPVRIPTTPDGVNVTLGHPAKDVPEPQPRISLRTVIDDALATAPVDHIITVAAANELIEHLERAIIDASGGEHHIVQVHGYSWELQHPITERFEGTLFGCRYTTLVAATEFEEDGTFQVWLDRSALRWEPVHR
jgi:hypothetical protein